MKKTGMSLYQKFAITIVIIGLVPMAILTTFMTQNMIQGYKNALKSQYEQAARYVSNSLTTMLDTYNTVSKMPYYYHYSSDSYAENNYLSYDNFRKIVYGDMYAPETMQADRKRDMENFLRYIGSVDASIVSTHFISDNVNGQAVDFHFSTNGTYLRDEKLFEEMIAYDQLDHETNKLMIVPIHETKYFNGLGEPVFAIGRNYFDLRGEVGHTPYVGTLVIEVNTNTLEKIFRMVKFDSEEKIYVVDQEGECFYSNDQDKISTNITDSILTLQDTQQQLILQIPANDYGLSIYVVMNTEDAFRNIVHTQNMMYLFLATSAVALLLSSLFFSKRLTRPIHEMMDQMKEVENGNFDMELTVRSNDEIGVLAQRFNQMSSTLQTYIEQMYKSKIRQSEAELTALKSQIYPHFLYNTLEIIRMSALEDENSKVPQMIEALAEQIHYLIGPMQDMVTLEQEINIVQKYVYLLNCRIAGKVQLMVQAPGANMIQVPRLILQPIVENAYVHGIKPKKGSGSVMIEGSIKDDILEISVMDNGLGMDEAALEKIRLLLAGNEPGIKNEYNWQSIGLKNVHDRIRFLYGEPYGIEITSTEGIGTMVRILMPAK